jgi:glycosyltransferase involved in cell wall biosynthesis
MKPTPDMPDLTIVIPAFRVERYIDATLAHARRIPDVPILIVDDASPDATWDRIQAFSRENPSRVRAMRNESNLGMTGNWRRAFELVRTPLALKLDADDIILPGFVARAVELMRRRPDVAIVGASGSRRIGPDELLDPAGPEIAYDPAGDVEVFQGEPAITRAFDWHPFPTSGSTIYRMSDYRAVGGFRAELRVCTDWDMWLRFARSRAIAIDPAVGLLYRHHPTSVLREAVGKSSLAHDWHAMFDALRVDWSDMPMHPRLRRTYRFVARRHVSSAWRRARSGAASDAIVHLAAAVRALVASRG